MPYLGPSTAPQWEATCGQHGAKAAVSVQAEALSRAAAVGRVRWPSLVLEGPSSQLRAAAHVSRQAACQKRSFNRVIASCVRLVAALLIAARTLVSARRFLASGGAGR